MISVTLDRDLYLVGPQFTHLQSGKKSTPSNAVTTACPAVVAGGGRGTVPDARGPTGKRSSLSFYLTAPMSSPPDPQDRKVFAGVLTRK